MVNFVLQENDQLRPKIYQLSISLLYAKIGHSDLINVLNKVIDAAFKGGIRNAILFNIRLTLQEAGGFTTSKGQRYINFLTTVSIMIKFADFPKIYLCIF